MDRILEILNALKPGSNFASSEDYIADGLLTSFEIINLVYKLADEFDVEIGVAEVIPQNFKNARAILEMIERLEDE